MDKILDLSIYEEDTLDIKTPKGNMIHVKKPTEELAIKLLSYQSKVEKMNDKDLEKQENVKKLTDMLKDLVKSILSNNKDDVKITDEWLKIEDINYSMKIAILSSYTKYMSEMTSNPNFNAPQSQGRKKKAVK
ncbi:hypothetical protein KYB31_15700 [Clostridium felsineum]|uniref:hypothetical protein n=1 Tax=Clostridium felsineum TaxID=36839 RepID=UPI00214D678C|nr:hypothetical protein [Clostridium felsineum]MCR3760422.1 hypothetical protein [Clostridium felsineum]